ncbi:MAG TPA: hypothetical protein VLG68_06270 [Gammaproteobacteria bacterium]|nr:hypothetical protein [Gammaproteobacteria bacterium]
MRDVILHHHVFKNAGSTIDWALQRHFRSAFVDHRDDKSMRTGGMRYVEEYLLANHGVSALSSHHMPFDTDYVADGFSFWHLFMMREPIARALSVYRFEKTQRASTPGAQMAKQLDMRGYFQWRLRDESPPVLRNMQTRWLCAVRGSRRLGEQEFQSALDRSKADRVLIGFVERFDESMVQAENALRGSFDAIDLAHVIQNRSRDRPEDPAATMHESLGDDLYREFCANNDYDLRLYRELEGRFAARTQADSGFQQQLEAYKSRCADLGGWPSMLRWVKS